VAVDARIGSVHDIAFDDRTWTIRYIIADTGKWLPGRLVLLSPASFGEPDWSDHSIAVSLTKQQIENSPSIDADKTVSRQHETELHKYYGWPAYWTYPPPGEMHFVPPLAPVRENGGEPEDTDTPIEQESHLRGVKEVIGYTIEATNGDIGHVEDFILQDDVWMIRYAVVDTRNWLPGQKVLVSPLWITAIRWDERTVHVDLTREAIKSGPEYDPAQPVNRDYEVRLYDFHGRPKYW
jgi:hypothetical protein